MAKIIIGLTGLNVSGKSTVADYLQSKHGAVSFAFSTVLRDIIKRLYLPMERTNIANLSTALRREFGPDLLSRVLLEDLKAADSPLIILEGIRRLTDVANIKDLPGFKLWAVKTDDQIRYQRLTGRGQNADDHKKTYAEFLADDQSESDRSIPEVIKEADLLFTNNGSLQELYAQVDKALSELK